METSITPWHIAHTHTEYPMYNNKINCKLEYIWLDGYSTPNIRSKSKYCNIPSATSASVCVDDVPEWGFDGSSTQQAEGGSSDCVLKPVALYKNTVDKHCCVNSYIVLCEVFDVDGNPHKTNNRATLRESVKRYTNSDMLFGIEQEYIIMDPVTNIPAGWTTKDGSLLYPQGKYYCGVGGDVVTMRELVDDHAKCGIMAGIPVCGTNAEVMLSQWEYQIGPAGPLEVSDGLLVLRYMLSYLAEQRGVYISLNPKEIEGDWNGSGAHINFSTEYMREHGGEEYITSICNALETTHDFHIDNYGIGNEERLTGDHETQSIDKFTWGNSDRGASIRIPPSTAETLKGYIEDRRPAANIDPYRAVNCLVKTIGVVDSTLIGV